MATQTASPGTVSQIPLSGDPWSNVDNSKTENASFA
jgi:hypothetical protein